MVLCFSSTNRLRQRIIFPSQTVYLRVGIRDQGPPCLSVLPADRRFISTFQNPCSHETETIEICPTASSLLPEWFSRSLPSFTDSFNLWITGVFPISSSTFDPIPGNYRLLASTRRCHPWWLWRYRPHLDLGASGILSCSGLPCSALRPPPPRSYIRKQCHYQILTFRSPVTHFSPPRYWVKYIPWEKSWYLTQLSAHRLFFFHFLIIALTILFLVVQLPVLSKTLHLQSISFPLSFCLALDSSPPGWIKSSVHYVPPSVKQLDAAGEKSRVLTVSVPLIFLSQVSHGRDYLVNLLSSLLHGFLFSQMAIS